MPMPEPLPDLVKTAVKLERDGIYALQIKESLSKDRLTELSLQLKRITDSIGVRFVVIGPEMELVTREIPAAEEDTIADTKA
jgi:hypothetical protein